MVDIVETQTRSRMMSSIKGKNTKPELVLRKILHAAGYRFRLHRKDLPGKPDLVLKKYNLVIFVHGCFWHRHKGCFYASSPSSNSMFWKDKLDKNVERDQKQICRLLSLGWRVLVVWECGFKQKDFSHDEIIGFITEKTSFIEWPPKPPRTRKEKLRD